MAVSLLFSIKEMEIDCVHGTRYMDILRKVKQFTMSL